MVTSQPTNEIALGKPCNYQGPDTNGFQCYYYGTEIPRSGIWIIPDLRYQPFESYFQAFPVNATRYETPDKKISFEYLKPWSVSEENWKELGTINVLMGKPSDIPPSIGVSVYQKNAVTVEDRIKQVKESASTVIENTIDLNGSTAIRLDTAPTNNLTEGSIVLFIDKGDYYVEVGAPIYNNPLYDFPTYYTLSTITVR